MESTETVTDPALEARAKRRKAFWLWANTAGGLLLYILGYPFLLMSVSNAFGDESLHALLIGGFPLVWLYTSWTPYEVYVGWVAEILDWSVWLV